MKRNNKQFYIFGRKPIEEIIELQPEKVMKISIVKGVNDKDPLQGLSKKLKAKKIAYDYIDKRTATRLVGEVNTQGVLALLSGFAYTELADFLTTVKEDSSECVLVLAGIEDTHNFGALLRTAAAVGISAVVISNKNQAPVNGTAFKTSAGTAGKVPVVRVANINDAIRKLKEKDFWIYAIDMEERGQGSIWDQKLDGKVAIILGAEGSGIPQKTKEISDFAVSIPMKNEVESLNVSVAGGIALYEWLRQQS